MPRVRSKGGYRQGPIDRRSRNGKAARLSAFLHRSGKTVTLLCLLVGGGTWIAASGVVGRAEQAIGQSFALMTAHNGFAIDDVLVQGRENADPDVLLGLLSVSRGDSILTFDPEAARQRLEKDSWIASARVERRLPGLVFIDITERVPFAFWQNQGKLRMVDAGGNVITDVPKEMARFKDLPLVVGDGAPQQAASLFTLLKAEPEILSRIQAATYVGGRRWDLQLKNNIAVRLPEDDLPLALHRLADAQGSDKLLDQPLDSIDLREKGRLIVHTKPDAAPTEQKASFKPGGKAI